jgi:uncharacterized membrane protein
LTTVYSGVFPRLVSSPRPLHESLPDFPEFAQSGWGVKRRLLRTGSNPKGATVPENTPQSGLSDDAASGIAYLTFIPAIIFLVTAPYNQSAKVRFHSWQSIIMAIVWVVLDIAFMIIGRIPFIGWFIFFLWPLLGLGIFILWLIVMINAFNGKRINIPVLSDLAQKQAGA